MAYDGDDCFVVDAFIDRIGFLLLFSVGVNCSCAAAIMWISHTLSCTKSADDALSMLTFLTCQMYLSSSLHTSTCLSLYRYLPSSFITSSMSSPYLSLLTNYLPLIVALKTSIEAYIDHNLLP